MGVLALLVFPLMSTGLGLRWCAYRWTRPVGGGRWGIICVTLGEFTGLHKNVHLMVMEMEVIPFSYAVCGSISETAQSPWLSCMYGIMG